MQNKYKYPLILFILLLNAFIFFFSTTLFYQFSFGQIYREALILLSARIGCTVCSVVLLFFVFFKGVLYNNNMTDTFKNMLLSVFTIIIIFYLTEIYFSFNTKSHPIGYSLASLIWYDKYWNPVNSSGFRDKEGAINHNKKSIVFIGDSFTAGAGIKKS